MDVSKNSGTPKWMVKIMENPIKMDDLGGKPPIFGNIQVRFGFSRNTPNSKSGCPQTLHTCTAGGIAVGPSTYGPTAAQSYTARPSDRLVVLRESLFNCSQRYLYEYNYMHVYTICIFLYYYCIKNNITYYQL